MKRFKDTKIYNKAYMFADEIKINHLDVYSAGAAFYIFISIIPFFIALFSLVPYTPVTQESVLSLSAMLPDKFSILVQAVTAEAYVKNSTRLWVSLFAGIWSAARGIMYITKGLNEIHDVREMRNYFVLRFWAAIYTMFMVAALVILLIFGVFGKRIMDFISVRLPHFPDRTGSLLATIIDFRVLISLAGLFLFFLFMYTVLPNKKLDVLYQIPGAVLGALGWWGFTDLFSKFTDLFDIFSMYGSLATVVASMLWMYCCMYIMFICAEINSHFAQMIISYIKGRKARRTAAAKENSD